MTKTNIHPDELCKLGLAVLETEASAISALAARLDTHFARACEILLACEGRIIVTGMGKSGHIGSKIAATLASTGSPAFYVHPGEAQHGDLGMITRKDVVLAMSKSGNTQEIISLVPIIKLLGVPFITLTGNPKSPLAAAADVNIDVSVDHEACPLDLAPTASTTATLAMGDALAIALLQARGFTADDFARSHPGGTLGKRLLLHVGDVMKQGDAVPKVSAKTTLANALVEMTEKKLGLTTIVDDKQHLLGIFTDGDLRRALDQTIDVHHTKIEFVMTSQCKTISSSCLAAEALALMEKHKITALVVSNNGTTVDGVIHMHDLLQAGIV